MGYKRIDKTENNEKPLDYIVEDGGYVSIFRNIAVIGDSLSSGEFETLDDDGNRGWHDFFDYSWGQYMARDAGIKVYNFSRGGMSCKEYIETFADSIDAYNTEKACEAYIIALGVNDLFGFKMPCGDIDDLENNKETISNYFQQIILKYKQIQKDAFFFLITMPRENDDDPGAAQKDEHQKLMYEIANKYENTFVLDIRKYGAVYDDEFKKKFYYLSHMNAAGYRYTAKIIESYIDYIIRNDFERFKEVGFIGKKIKNFKIQ